MSRRRIHSKFRACKGVRLAGMRRVRRLTANKAWHALCRQLLCLLHLRCLVASSLLVSPGGLCRLRETTAHGKFMGTRTAIIRVLTSLSSAI